MPSGARIRYIRINKDTKYLIGPLRPKDSDPDFVLLGTTYVEYSVKHDRNGTPTAVTIVRDDLIKNMKYTVKMTSSMCRAELLDRNFRRTLIYLLREEVHNAYSFISYIVRHYRYFKTEDLTDITFTPKNLPVDMVIHKTLLYRDILRKMRECDDTELVIPDIIIEYEHIPIHDPQFWEPIDASLLIKAIHSIVKSTSVRHAKSGPATHVTIRSDSTSNKIETSPLSRKRSVLLECTDKPTVKKQKEVIELSSDSEAEEIEQSPLNMNNITSPSIGLFSPPIYIGLGEEEERIISKRDLVHHDPEYDTEETQQSLASPISLIETPTEGIDLETTDSIFTAEETQDYFEADYFIKYGSTTVAHTPPDFASFLDNVLH